MQLSGCLPQTVVVISGNSGIELETVLALSLGLRATGALMDLAIDSDDRKASF